MSLRTFRSSSICSDEELLEELKKLGYDTVSPDMFSRIKDDLIQLVEEEEVSTPTLHHLSLTDSFRDLNIENTSSSFDSFSRKTLTTEAFGYGNPFIQKQLHFDEEEFIDENHIFKDKNTSKKSQKVKPKRYVKRLINDICHDESYSPTNCKSRSSSKNLSITQMSKEHDKVENDHIDRKGNYNLDSSSNSDGFVQYPFCKQKSNILENTSQDVLHISASWNSSSFKNLGRNRKSKSPRKIKNDQIDTKENYFQMNFSNSETFYQKPFHKQRSKGIESTSEDELCSPINYNSRNSSTNLGKNRKSKNLEKLKSDQISTKKNYIQVNSSNSNSLKQNPYCKKGSKVRENSLPHIMEKTDSDISQYVQNSPVKLSKRLQLNLSSQSSTSSETTIKRKILRRKNGQAVVTEEFLKIPSVFDTSYPESESLNNSKSSSGTDLSPKSNSSTGSVSVISPESSLKKSTSVLSLSSKCSTATRILNSRKKKHDPVAMYGYYKKFWDNFKPPGEKTHDKLRWAVRDRMLDYNL